MEAQLTDPCVQRGAALAKSMGASIKPIVGSTYLVPSASHSGARYVVNVGDEPSCSCPDFLECSACGTRPHRCKHLIAVLIVTREIVLLDGNSIVVSEDKIKFQIPRNWSVTNASLVDLPRVGPAMIQDLVSGIPLTSIGMRSRGRPRVEPRDVAHAAILRAFEHRAARQTVEVMERNQELGLWPREPMHYNTLLEKLGEPALMPILQDLVSASAQPVVNIARNFAIDSTGFTTTVFESWFRKQHGTSMQRAQARKHKWVKCHACVDTDYGVITAVAMTQPRVGDSPMLEELIHKTKRDGFSVQNFTADAAYISTHNIEVVENIGGKPYIMFRKNMNGSTSPTLARLFGKFTSDYEQYMKVYHQRSNIESCFGVLKTMWGGNVAARKDQSMYNQIMCKVICHNISRILRIVHEFGIEPKFWMPPSLAAIRDPMQLPSLNNAGEPTMRAVPS